MRRFTIPISSKIEITIHFESVNVPVSIGIKAQLYYSQILNMRMDELWAQCTWVSLTGLTEIVWVGQVDLAITTNRYKLLFWVLYFNLKCVVGGCWKQALFRLELQGYTVDIST